LKHKLSLYKKKQLKKLPQKNNKKKLEQQKREDSKRKYVSIGFTFNVLNLVIK
jgi:hypothetical protein